jgi:hypothetical protein
MAEVDLGHILEPTKAESICRPVSQARTSTLLIPHNEVSGANLVLDLLSCSIEAPKVLEDRGQTSGNLN